MAETAEIEAAPAAAPVAAAPAEAHHHFNHDEPLPHYDDALLIRVKGKVKKPVRPDDTERNLQIEKLNAEIKKHGDRIAEIKATLMARRTRGPNPEAAEAKSKKDALRGEWNAVLAQKMHIREEFQRANTEREVLRNELRETRSKIPRGTKVDTLEADVAAVEYRLQHESLSATEEKKAQQTLTSLTAARPLGRAIATLEEKLKATDVARASAKGRLDQCDAVLNGIKAKEQEQGAALDAIRKTREDANVDIPALEVEKQECWEVIQAMRAKLSEVRDDYNKKWNEWSELNKNYNAWLRHDRKNQFEERQKQREAREADREAEFGTATGATSSQAEPYESEIFTIDQLITYLRKFLVSETDSVAKAAEQKPVEVPQGLKPFKRKDEEDLSFFSAVPKKGASKGGKGAKQAAEKAADKTSAPDAKRKLNHSLDILKTFMTLGIDVPLNTSEMQATIDKAEAKKQEFLDKRKRAKEAPAASSKVETQELTANGEEVSGSAEEEAKPVEEEKVEEKAEEAAAAVEEKVAAVEEVEVEEKAAAKAEDKAEEKAEVKAAEKVEEKVEEKAAEAAAEEPKDKKKKKKKGGAAAEEKPAEAKVEAKAEEVAKAAQDVDMTLAVDKVTEEVSVKLRVSASG